MITADTDRQRAHHDRWHDELHVTPRSPRCAVWLLYGIEPTGTDSKGNALRRGNFNQRVKWVDTVKRMGLVGLHFHDLRHAGNIWAAQTKVSTKDLMARMGHDDMRAALIYQRDTSEAADRMAAGLSALVRKHQRVGQERRPRGKAARKRARRTGPDDGPTGSSVPVD